MTMVFNAVGLPKEYIAMLLTVDWFLDGRRKAPGPGEDPGSDVVQRPMDVPGSGPAIGG